MFTYVDYPPEGYELVPGKCPNEGRPCFCIGDCQPTLRRVESEEETD